MAHTLALPFPHSRGDVVHGLYLYFILVLRQHTGLALPRAPTANTPAKVFGGHLTKVHPAVPWRRA